SDLSAVAGHNASRLGGLWGRQVPPPGSPVLTAGDQPVAVSADGHSPDLLFLTRQGEDRCSDCILTDQIPETDNTIPTPCSDAAVIRAKGYSLDRLLMATDQGRLGRVGGAQPPPAGGLVPTSGD